MPTFSQPYFLDGTSLLDSTSIYLNSALTICAPDGYYSDGFNIRRLVGCVLEPSQPCPECGFPCGQDLTTSGELGYYVMNIDTGTLSTSVGAIVILFASGQIPDGVMVEYNGNIYNELSSPYYGYLAAPPNEATFIGQLSYDCGIVAGSPHIIDKYEFDGSSFIPTGTTESVTVTAPQLQLTPTSPDNGPTWNPGDPKLWSAIVIPKTSTTPSTITLKVIALCTTTGFLLSVSCPSKIKKINASIKFDDPLDPAFCDAPLTNQLFPVRVNGVSPYLGLYDWIFTDEYGQNKAADGYYRTNNLTGTDDTIQVQNGVIIAITNQCP
jgi:hypothetical protein